MPEMHRCSYAHEFRSLPANVRETLEDESYRSFMAVPGTDGDWHDAPVPAPVARTVSRLLSTANFGPLTKGNHPVSERLAHEAVSWCDERWSHVRMPEGADVENPDALLTCTTLEEARRVMPPVHRRNLHDLAKRVLTNPGGPLTAIEVAARIRFVADRWSETVAAERERNETRELGRALGSYVRELSSALPKLLKAQPLVRDLFGTEETLWDSSLGEWTETNWDSIATIAEVLNDLPELDHLAAILGRSRVSTEPRVTRRTVEEVSTRMVGLGKSEVTGFTFGDDLSSLIPSEMALLSNPDTEELFYAKLAHRELLQFDYRREKLVRAFHERTVTSVEDVTVPRGPIILCIDTSGSMLGDPELVAKAFSLALCRRLTIDERHIHVVIFSTATRSFTIEPGSLDLRQLGGFLGSGFHGGTDLRPALAEALRTLEDDQFRNADVLVISDFRIPKIADHFIERIKNQQASGTLFHSLTVARGAVRDPLHIFDHSWLFSLTEGARGIRPDTLRPIA